MQFDDWSEIIQQGAMALGLGVSVSQIKCFYQHMCELRHWNRKINLTAITNPSDIAIKHFLDAISAAEQVGDAARILDVGSGAGFPGLPLKIMRPASHLTVIDSSRKKINFIRHVIRQLGLDQARALQTRIEDFAADASRSSPFDVIVSRAFTNAASLTRLTMPFIENAGVLLVWKGPEIEDEIRDLERLPECRAKGLTIKVHPYRLPMAYGDRHLISVKKA